MPGWTPPMTSDVRLDQDEIDLIMRGLMTLYGSDDMTADEREVAALIAFKLGMAASPQSSPSSSGSGSAT